MSATIISQIDDLLNYKGKINAPTDVFFSEHASVLYSSADTFIDGIICEVRRMNNNERTDRYLDLTNKLTTISFEDRMDILGFYLGLSKDGGNMTGLFGRFHNENKRLAYKHFGALNKNSLHPAVYWDENKKWFKEGGDIDFAKGLMKLCEGLVIERDSEDILVPVFYLYMLMEFISTGDINQNVASNIRWNMEV